MTRPPSRPTIEIAAPTTSPDALSLASADNAPGFRTFARLGAGLVGASALSASAASLAAPKQASTPFTFQRIDHIVLRCRDTQKMLDFYVGVLGAEPEWVGRMDGCLSHLRIGSSLIDLQGYEAPGGRRLHAGGQGLPADAPKPEIDPTKGTLDHFAINLEPYDPESVTEYLTAAGHAPYAQGQRYGADGDGYSIYLTDPEGTVVELKSGN